jgi:tetratricopeptide (TPR) repeat protein
MGGKRITAAIVLALCALVSCGRDPKVAARNYLDSGNRYFNKGRFAEARLMYIRAKQKDLRFGEAYYRWGLSEIKLGSYGPAVQAFERAIEQIPANSPLRWDAMIRLSDIYLVACHQERDPRIQKQYIADVGRWSGELLKRDANSFDGHRVAGDLELAKSAADAAVAEKQGAAEHLDKAIEEYHKADAIKPGQTIVLMQLARTAASQGDLPAAERSYREVLDRDKNLQAAYTELYKLLWFENTPDDAEDVLKLACRNNPGEVGYLTTLALQYSLQHRKSDMAGVLDQIQAHAKEYPDAYIVVGDFYYRQGDHDAAIAEYNQGIARDPQRKVSYQKHIIEVMLHQGRRAEALELNVAILKEAPKDPDARGLAAAFLLDQGDAAKAITELEAVVTTAPDNPVARLDLGRAYAEKGAWEQARQSFQKSLEIKPDYLLPRVALAKLQLSRNEYGSALKSAQAILANYDRNNSTAELIVTGSLIGQHQYGEARRLLESMTEGGGGSPDVYLQLGVLNLEDHKLAECQGAFRKAYELNPTDSRGLMGVVRCYLADNKSEAALALLQTESDKAPARADLRLAVANVGLDMGKFDLAIAEYQNVLGASGKNTRQRAAAYLRLGEAYQHKGDYSSAIANMQKARESEPDETTVLISLALALDEAGRTSESKQTYEAALKLDPNNGLVLNNLAFLLAEHGGDLNDALIKALKARQLLPNLRNASDTLGWIYLKKGLNDNAIDIFKQLVDKAPAEEQAAYRYHLAMALSQKGAKTEAVKELRESLKYDPSKGDREKIQQLLVRLSGT